MKTATALPLAATVLLHAALVAAGIGGLAIERIPDTAPLKVTLLAPPPAVLPAEPSPPRQAAWQPPPAQKRREPAPAAKSKPAPAPRTAARAPIPTSEPRPDPAPSTSSTITSSAPPAASPAAAPGPATPAPTASAAPARTGASDARYAATNRKPPYPRLSRSNEEEGTVVLRVLVTAEGTAGAVEIRHSSNYPLLDESARRTVQNWRFKPATVNGNPVAEWYEVSVPFKLENN